LSISAISGRPADGHTLTATATANDSDASISYQWQANHGSGFANIAGATSSSYVVQSADDGATLRVTATSSDADGGGASATSAATSAVVTDVGPSAQGTSITAVPTQIIAVAPLITTTSDPDQEPTAAYGFWNSGFGFGHFVISANVPNINDVLATQPNPSQFSQLTYEAGTDTDSLFVRATDGFVWSAWSNAFTVTSVNSATIASGATLELGVAIQGAGFSGTIAFASGPGTLRIDQSSSFGATITGQLATGDVIDLTDITAGAKATMSYTGNNSPGTLTVSDGAHTAHIALTGNYSLANFIASSDGHGGTQVIDPPTAAGGTFDQNVALIGSYMASAFPSSGSGNDGTSPLPTPASPPSLVKPL
jgi:hypothetical protein